jgi:hypothetical protein
LYYFFLQILPRPSIVIDSDSLFHVKAMVFCAQDRAIAGIDARSKMGEVKNGGA